MPIIVPTGPTSNTVADTLLARLDAAQAAFSRRQPSIAVQLLETFIREVEVQKGKRIHPDCAGRLKTQAQKIIDAILTSSTLKPAFLQAGVASMQRIEIGSQPRERLTAEHAVPMAGALASGFKA